MIEIYVPGVPAGQPRPRATLIGKEKHIRIYSPKMQYTADVRQAAAAAYDGRLVTGPVCLCVIWRFPRPAAKIWKRKPMVEEPHTLKPDIDNLLKAVMDALTTVVYADDRQVCQITSLEKVIHAGGDKPGTWIAVCDAIRSKAGAGS